MWTYIYAEYGGGQSVGVECFLVNKTEMFTLVNVGVQPCMSFYTDGK